MVPTNPPQLEDRIARCRLILSVVAIAAVFADPTAPFIAHWYPISSGRFTIDPWVLVVMGAHLLYSLLVYQAATRGRLRSETLSQWTTWTDVAIGAAIAFLTEGATSPFYPFFAFAVVVAGFRSGLREAMKVTAVSVVLYLGLIEISSPGNLNVYVMRPAYLAIVGYLVGYLGQQRIDMQQEIQQLEAAEQRHRIARDLHDGFAQALAGINLKIESCRRLLRSDRTEDALSEMTDLQQSVHREYDELRTYMQTLAGIQPSPVTPLRPVTTRATLEMNVEGSIDLVDHILQIVREGISNVRRHSSAARAEVRIGVDGSRVRITIDDDGIGLEDETAPWSIASRVRELGGQIQVDRSEEPGSHLRILLPQC
jgi:signal transduction histidine kinase